jgi:hypothetical protein
MLATPAEFMKAHTVYGGGGFVVVDWSCAEDIVEIVGDVEIAYSDPWLANKLANARAKLAALRFIETLPKPEIFNVAA